MKTCLIYEEYEKKLDNLQYKYRKEILNRVLHYLDITKSKDTISYAMASRIIKDRIIYHHHYVLGF